MVPWIPIGYPVSIHVMYHLTTRDVAGSLATSESTIWQSKQPATDVRISPIVISACTNTYTRHMPVVFSRVVFSVPRQPSLITANKNITVSLL